MVAETKAIKVQNGSCSSSGSALTIVLAVVVFLFNLLLPAYLHCLCLQNMSQAVAIVTAIIKVAVITTHTASKN